MGESERVAVNGSLGGAQFDSVDRTNQPEETTHEATPTRPKIRLAYRRVDLHRDCCCVCDRDRADVAMTYYHRWYDGPYKFWGVTVSSRWYDRLYATVFFVCVALVFAGFVALGISNDHSKYDAQVAEYAKYTCVAEGEWVQCHDHRLHAADIHGVAATADGGHESALLTVQMRWAAPITVRVGNRNLDEVLALLDRPKSK